MYDSIITDPNNENEDLGFEKDLQSYTKGIFDRIIEGLAPYVLLYDIPFCYLLPGEALLPPNSLRFFYLDFDWVLSFLDGALSPGRTADIDVKHDKVLAYNAFAYAMQNAEKIRRILQGKEPLNPITKVNSGNEFKPKICTGFLIRSPLVTGWRGLEFKAYDEKKEELRALRIETLAEDVLLAIFFGEINHFTLSEPPEGLYYGVENSKGELSAGLRNLEDGKQDGEESFNIIQRENRVINFAATAQNIAEMSGNIDIEKINSAIMALQLTRTAKTLDVYVSTKPKGET
ncbi:MAG: hypothetical protein LBU89_11970 [Fibromonadaceae bacterium]|jgi:hypothetical protein|nr:hypothetical protein [Fibromonadaceae bacterium]